jgi:hypothetical protein
VNKKLIRITFMLAALAMIAAGCAEQYAGNPALRNLYRVLNYPTSYKERALCFEMEDYERLVDRGEFYIMGSGISTPAAYPCSENETLLSAIEKAGQTASFSSISYTLIKGIRDDEREIRGLALLSGSAMSPEVDPGDLICLKSMPSSVALSQ